VDPCAVTQEFRSAKYIFEKKEKTDKNRFLSTLATLSGTGTN